jgi:hypothetical protein
MEYNLIAGAIVELLVGGFRCAAISRAFSIVPPASMRQAEDRQGGLFRTVRSTYPLPPNSRMITSCIIGEATQALRLAQGQKLHPS